ncbi:hypothetical protein ACVWZ4_005746 [Bradyrhizobium sp. USDA 4472]
MAGRELSLLNLFAFAATRRLYRRTMSSLEAPAMRSAADPIASATFSRTISLASRRARFPPAISFNIRSPMTSLASRASIIQDWSSLCFPARRNMVAPLVLSFSAGIHLAIRDVASRVGRLAGRADRHPSAHKSALLHLVPIHFGNQATVLSALGQHAKNSERANPIRLAARRGLRQTPSLASLPICMLTEAGPPRRFA